MSNKKKKNKIADKRKLLKHLLSKCTREETSVFNRMYGSLKDVKDHQLDWAIQQCERTIEVRSPEYKLKRELDKYKEQLDE